MKTDLLPRLKKIHAAFIVGTLIIIVGFGVGAVIASAATFKSFSPQFFIAGIDVGGKTLPEAQKILTQKLSMMSKGITVEIPGYGTRVISVTPDAFDIDATLSHAKNVASRDALTKQARDLFGAGQRTDINIELADDAMKNISPELIASWNLPLTHSTNATFAISAASVSVVPSQNGQTIDLAQLREGLWKALMTGENRVSATIVEATPEITTAIAEELRPQASALAGEITKGRMLKIKDKAFAVTAANLAALLQPRMYGGIPTVGIDAVILKSLLGSQLAQFEQEPKNPAFQYSGKHVTTFQAPQLGVAIDWDSLARDLSASLSTNVNSVTVVTKDAQPEVILSTTNDLGINEIIGSGTSDFSGSTSNRIHNIETGMKAINGSLIAPGEDFSLIKTLGAIDGTTGYVQELVIKDNKTQPEFGGGLCQIGTTTFRAAMGAGFPILERQNHSYQVHYYFENGVSGTDATIYDPKPDFRFKNDTAHWVMLETKISKPDHKLEFRFWGTLDGRKASRTIPKMLASKPAPPKVQIPTTTLPPGKIKCTELAHVGATMLFTYTVDYPDGTTKKEDFKSIYKPWGEVCLIGVVATSTPSGGPVTMLNPNAIISPDVAGVAGN